MFYSSTELEKRAEQVLPGREGEEEEGRNDPNNVHTYE
jgi:hypothetical protein